MSDAPVGPSKLPKIGRVTVAELIAALRQGALDFRRAPAFGIFFSGFYVAVGLGLVLANVGTFVWTLVMALGFPLIAPFAAVGLYEVSRRLEAEVPLVWSEVLGSVLREKDRQIPWIGAILVIIFLFWSFVAHLLFALFMGLSTLTNVSSSYDVFFTPTGLAMIAAEVVVGGIAAFLVFSVTVVSLPLLLEREVDFVTAMLHSMRTVGRNLPVMLIWAAIIAALLFVGMIPYFLGLFVVLPILGHATWHLYRRALYDPV